MATKKAAAEPTVLSDEVEDPDTASSSAGNGKIPKLVDKLLQAYPGYKKLYVDEKCGAFVEGSKLPVNYKVTLYDNPYFKE